MISKENLTLLLKDPFYCFTDRPKEAKLYHYFPFINRRFVDDAIRLTGVAFKEIKSIIENNKGILDITEFYDVLDEWLAREYRGNDGVVYHEELKDEQYVYIIALSLWYLINFGYKVEIKEKTYTVYNKKYKHLIAKITK